jgi:hypothetical protein
MVLAAQMAELRDQIAGPALFERLTACGELLADLVSHIGPDAQAAAAAAKLDKALDELAFRQAQQQDMARQTADLVMQALKILSAETLSLGYLKTLYVSDRQRRLHDEFLAVYD